MSASHPPHTDTVAEIQNTLQAGTNVKLSGVEIAIASGRYAVPSGVCVELLFKHATRIKQGFSLAQELQKILTSIEKRLFSEPPPEPSPQKSAGKNKLQVQTTEKRKIQNIFSVRDNRQVIRKKNR